MTSFFASKGLRASPSPEAVLDGIWVPGSTHDAVAEGAAIYGARLLAGAPSYLDTLPQLWTYAQARGKLDWVALLEAEEVEGGQKFARVLQQKFSLPRHAKTLQVFLRKGHEQIRKAAFHFPYVSEESMPLDTHIAMSPASGLAQIELVPIQTDFLRGQRVFLDYALMEDATEAELPKPQLGFPPLMKIQVDPEDRRLLSVVKTAWDTFRDIHIRGELHQYCTAVGELKAIVTPQLSFPSAANRVTRGRIVDQDGQAGTPQGQALIQHLAAKLGEDLRTLHHQPLVGTTEQRRSIVGDIRQAATWLFAGAPSEVIQYLKSELEKIHGEGSHQHLIEAASRALTDVDDLKLLYRAISRVITYRGCHPRPNQARFPLNSVRALYNVMALRTSGPEAMTRPEAATFVAATLCTMEDCVQANNYAQKFSHAAKLFLYLLRYRQVDQTFLVEVNVQDRQLFDRAIGCLESAQRFWQTKGNDLRAEKCTALMQEIKNYMVFQGSPDIIEILNAVDDLSGETDSDET